jgi:SAM-dependent methyltransferase
LAERGWQVVGVDVVPRAIDAARHRAEQAGVDVTFKEGDVTALRAASVGSNFNLLLDMECFNWLSDSDRSRMAQEVDEVAAPDATLLLLVWARARRGPLPTGADRQDLETTFSGWRITDEHPYEGVLPRPLKSIDPRWYRLHRVLSINGHESRALLTCSTSEVSTLGALAETQVESDVSPSPNTHVHRKRGVQPVERVQRLDRARDHLASGLSAG